MFKAKLYIFGLVAAICLGLSNGQRRFPNYFKLGTATASYQIEGAWNEDGKGETIWDYLVHNTPERVEDRTNGDIACDSYHKYKEDVQNVKALGMDFYRFSIAWSRILPKGDTSRINEAGLRYYDNLINELLANGIEPMVTIYHWDLPQPLQELGGFTNPIISDYFVDFADILFTRYGDRVKTWITFNEPVIICEQGYGNPSKAPYITSPGIGNYLCAHNLILSHAAIYRLYEQKYKRADGKVGITINCAYTWPMDPNNPSDVEAGDRSFQTYCGWYTHPIYSKAGGYPQVMIDLIGANSKREGRPWSRLPEFTPEQIDFIRGTGDFIGLNYYSSNFGTSRETTGPPSFWNDQAISTRNDNDNNPEGLRLLLNKFADEYDNKEIIITENGYNDNGRLDDTGRIEYLRGHLNAVLDAIEDGVNITAHTTWSLMDVFEWLGGYVPRLGLFHIDHTSPNRTRTPKQSAGFITQVAATRVVPPRPN